MRTVAVDREVRTWIVLGVTFATLLALLVAAVALSGDRSQTETASAGVVLGLNLQDVGSVLAK